MYDVFLPIVIIKWKCSIRFFLAQNTIQRKEGAKSLRTLSLSYHPIFKGGSKDSILTSILPGKRLRILKGFLPFHLILN